MKFVQWNSMLWAKGEGEYPPCHFLLANIVEVQCMPLYRVWHSTTFLEIVETLYVNLGILDLRAVSTFGLWHSLICSLEQTSFIFSHLLLILFRRDVPFLEENVLEHLRVL